MSDEFDDFGEDYYGPQISPEAVAQEQAMADAEADWEARGKKLTERHAEALSLLRAQAKHGEKLTKCRWEIGDWLIDGLEQHPVMGSEVVHGYYIPAPPDAYSIAEEITGLTRNTLRDLASTARRCPPSVRTDACDWTLHRTVVNALPKADHDAWKEWLKRAADEKLSFRKLERAIKHPKGAPVKEKSFRVTVPLKVWETLKDFADNENCTVNEIAQKWLVKEAGLLDTEMNRIMAKEDTEARRKARRQEVGRRVARAYDPLRLRRD